MANQIIRFKRNELVFNNYEAAIVRLNAIDHLKGQPIIAYYNDGDNSPKIILAIGTEDGKGKYKIIASIDNLGDFVKAFQSHISTIGGDNLGHVKNGGNVVISGDGSMSVDLSGYQEKGDYQPLDGDLTAIAELTGANGLLKKDGDNSWSIDTTVYAADNTVVHKTEDESIDGKKTFIVSPIAPTPISTSNDTSIATTAFVTSKVNEAIAGIDGALVYKGIVDAEHALPDKHTHGWTYVVAANGIYAGETCEVGDMIICVSTGDVASDDDWNVVQTNINGAVTGPSSSVANHIATFDGSTGKIIKDSGFTIQKNVPSDAKFTDTTYTFADGINSFTVTPLNGAQQTVNITPSIDNNVIYTGTTSANQVAVFNGSNDGIIKGVDISTIVPDITINNGQAEDGKYISSISSTKHNITVVKNDLPSIPTTLPNPNPLTLKINSGSTEGTNLFTYNGATSKSLDIIAGDNITLNTTTPGKITINAVATQSLDWGSITSKPSLVNTISSQDNSITISPNSGDVDLSVHMIDGGTYE